MSKSGEVTLTDSPYLHSRRSAAQRMHVQPCCHYTAKAAFGALCGHAMPLLATHSQEEAGGPCCNLYNTVQHQTDCMMPVTGRDF